MSLGENPPAAGSLGLFFAVLALIAGGSPGSRPTIRWPPTPPARCSRRQRAHWFGTDQLGRDIFSRVIVATRLDLGIAGAVGRACPSLSAASLGLAAGYFGGWVDRIIGRVADTIMAFPLFVLAMGIVAALGNTVANIVYRHRDHQPADSMPASRAPR